jgi:hypothetical protein
MISLDAPLDRGDPAAAALLGSLSIHLSPCSAANISFCRA